MLNRKYVIGAVVISLAATYWIQFGTGGGANVTGHSGGQVPSAGFVPGSVSTPPPIAQRVLEYQKLAAQVESDYKSPIEFYGKVIDQYGKPVPEANVWMSALDSPDRPGSEYRKTTDVNGTFSLSGAGGLTLSVEVSKPGFRVIPYFNGKQSSSGVFRFGVSDTGPHLSSMVNPTVFILHKIGDLEPLVKVEDSLNVARDGRPLTIALDGKSEHKVVLRCWNTDLKRPVGQHQYDWKLEINVPEGGLLLRGDAFVFEAPVDGYLQIDTVDMPMSLGAKWRSFSERSYFIRFSDDTYARVDFRMRAGGDHFVVWESFYNPKLGSRNLASDPNAKKY